MTGGPGKKLCTGEMENMCSRTRLAAACVDESGHLALVNAGDCVPGGGGISVQNLATRRQLPVHVSTG